MAPTEGEGVREYFIYGTMEELRSYQAGGRGAIESSFRMEVHILVYQHGRWLGVKALKPAKRS